jgi:hypothetical protein
MTRRAVELIGTTDWELFWTSQERLFGNAEGKKVERTGRWQLNDRRQRLHNPMPEMV